jgi:LPPG:FO 2-phospho-L-lactate transferase
LTENGSVVVLSGGTGGAKLARGMLDVVGAERLTVIANTGDDIEIYGGYVSPDPDLVSFWLADRIDERGWGLDGDSFTVMDTLRELGDEIWFNLGDQDLAIAIKRAQALAQGRTLTDAQLELNSRLGVAATVLPMSDRPVRTRVLADGRWWPLQEFLITARGQGEVQDVQFRGSREAGSTPEVREAIANADVIVIGPSNPIISIGPMLAIDELREAVIASPASVVAVSPIVGGAVLKGPTASFMRYRDVEVSARGLAALYEGVIDGIVTDEQLEPPLPCLRTDLLMEGREGRARLARETLDFAQSHPVRRPLPSSFPAG